ncbi:hypothetical protein [Methylotenera sp.]|uniref:hypothetical protein n=1 Tax=Methylotenera sp. TaxID=2051956 RepID=UPI00272426E3|nr:hypothetical protein [Methylotenera sp.]MDO9204846.1 hypothetical protein [Methylotenera sp.]MDP1523958.1 hypothetical protein [Methylotenera sp.]
MVEFYSSKNSHDPSVLVLKKCEYKNDEYKRLDLLRLGQQVMHMQDLFLPKLRAISRSTMIAALMFTACVLILYLFQITFSSRDSIFSNWVVPDGVTLHEAAIQFTSGLLNTDDLQPGWGAFAFYYPSKWVGEVAYFLINLACLLVVGRRLGFVSILFFPYFIVAMALPSKDILILFVSLIFMIHLIDGRWFIALLIALLSYFIRDGSAFVLVSIFLAYQVMRRNIFPPIFMVVIAFVVGALLFGLLNDFFGDTFIVARNLSVYEQNSSSLLGYGSWFDYYVRVFGNATNLAFRPSLLDENGGISVVAVGYFVSGISMLTSLICSAHTIIYNKSALAVKLAVALLVSLAVISLNPFVQGRYLFPYSVIFLGYLIYSGRLKYVLRIYIFTIMISLIAMMAYSYSGIPGTAASSITLFNFFE